MGSIITQFPSQQAPTPHKTSGRVKKIRGQLYDFGTRNRSFINVARELKQLGIKNFYFMLRVYDPSVVDIDPYDPHITKDQINRVILECSRNMWYYIREVVRIPDQGGLPVPYKANRGNIAQAWCIDNHIDSCLCMPRQQGKTVSAIAEQSWGYQFGTSSSQFIFVNKSSTDSNVNLSRMKTILDNLPVYMKFSSCLSEDGKLIKKVDNATKIKHAVNANEVVTRGQATSLAKAQSIARGLTSPIQHFDEVEFTPYIDVILSNSAPTYLKAASNAAKNNAMFCRILTSTPGDLSTKEGQCGDKVISSCAPWTEDYYDRPLDEVRESIRNKSKNNIVYIEYQYYQLGLDEKWLMAQAKSIGDDTTVRREILLQRIHGSSASPYSQEDIEVVINNIQPIIEQGRLKYGLYLDMYRKLNRHQVYIMGVDCATGNLGDSHAITVVDPYTMEAVAEFKCNYISEPEFADVIEQIVNDFIPRAIVCIERNNTGNGIISILLRSSIAGRIYFDKDKDLVARQMVDEGTVESMLKRKAMERKYYGVYTEGNSRKDMFTILDRHMYEYKDKFVTRNVSYDISYLVRTTSGKIEAAEGKHDDSIMSYLIAMYVFYHGNNLPMFGFIRGSEEIENQNQGMTHEEFEVRAKTVLPKDVVESVSRNMRMEEQTENEYAEMYRQALMKSQEESMKLMKAGLVQTGTYENTPEDILEDYDDEGSIDLSLFNDLNFF